jgi:drug/metabolite transporter (DMT)-like permease
VGVGLALVASLLWGTSDFLGGTLSRRVATVDVIAVSQLVAGAVLTAYVVATGAWHAPIGYLPWALAAGVAWMIAIAAFYTALAEGVMGVVAPIAACGVVVPVVAALVSGERPDRLEVLGVAAAVAGVVASCGPSLGRRGDRSLQTRPLALALLAAVLFGAEILFVAHGSRTSVPMTLLGMRVASVACVVVAVAVTGRPRPSVRPGSRAAVVALGVLDCAAISAYAVASRHGMVSLVALLASLYPVVTVVLARQLHAERLDRVQTLGVIAACSGAACIGLGSALT